MLNKNTKAMVCSFDGNTDFIDIVARKYISTNSIYNLFKICLDCILQISKDLMKENSLTLKAM